MDRHSSEIWATVRRYGAGEFAHMESDTQAATYFIIRDRWIQLLLAMPAPKAAELTKTEAGADRSASAVETAREPAYRSRWQARALIIEAQFEVVEVGIVVFEDEPLANTVPPGASIAFGEVLPENMRLAREKTALDRSAVCKRELVLVSQGPPSKNPRPLARLRGDVAQRAWIARSCPAR